METLLFICIAYFGLSYVYTLIMTISSKFYKEDQKEINIKKHSYAIVIPAYKEDNVILDTVYSAIHQNYDANKFKVYVIADQLRKDTIQLLGELGSEVIEVDFPKSTKVKSLRVFSMLFGSDADYTIILDADNCIESSFLQELNTKLISDKFKVIQVQRKSKNVENGISFLDAFSEYANTAILSKGPNLLSLSSKLSGSGMILKSTLFNKLIMNMDCISGFDKEMELKLTKQNEFIHYFDSPYVLDEKLANANQIKTQRSRWIYAQFDYLVKFFKSGLHALIKGELDHAHKVFQLALPPRVLGLIALTILNLIVFSTNNSVLIEQVVLVDGLFFASYSFLFLQFSRKHKIPKGIISEMIKVVIGYMLTVKYFKKASKEFLHTYHTIS